VRRETPRTADWECFPVRFLFLHHSIFKVRDSLNTKRFSLQVDIDYKDTHRGDINESRSSVGDVWLDELGELLQ
jgi:hypothetical protein